MVVVDGAGGGGVNTTMKDKHLNLEDAASHPPHNKAAQLMVLEPPPPIPV